MFVSCCHLVGDQCFHSPPHLRFPVSGRVWSFATESLQIPVLCASPCCPAPSQPLPAVQLPRVEMTQPLLHSVQSVAGISALWGAPRLISNGQAPARGYVALVCPGICTCTAGFSCGLLGIGTNLPSCTFGVCSYAAGSLRETSDPGAPTSLCWGILASLWVAQV